MMNELLLKKEQLEAELKTVNELIEIEKNKKPEFEETTYTKFKVGGEYFIRLSSYADKKINFTCTDRKENKVKGIMDGKKEKWYDIILMRKLRNGKLCEVDTEVFAPDKRVSSYVKATQRTK